MQNTVKVTQWLADNADNIVEFPARTVQQQLDIYDKVGTGIGFVLVLQAVVEESETEAVATRAEVVSVVVVKIKNEWYTTADPNLADIMSAIIRMLTRQ
jgi:hypothetical protein